jgi:membrane protease YdiL (CAAX protease family)
VRATPTRGCSARRGGGWWRPLLGLLGLGFGVVFGGVVITLLAVIVVTATGASGDSVTEDALDPDTVLGLLANNLILASIIPAAALTVLVVHQERPGWLASVTGRVRWGLLARLAPLALVVVLVFFGLGLLVPGTAETDGSTPTTATLVGLLAVILLTTPLQAAAEETGFRGYITQAVSSWFARPVVGILVGGAVSAVCFALAHGVQDPWLFADRLCFGVVASWLAWRTGRLGGVGGAAHREQPGQPGRQRVDGHPVRLADRRRRWTGGWLRWT